MLRFPEIFMDYQPLIDKNQERFAELEEVIAAGEIYNDPARSREVLKEHSRLKKLLDLWREFTQFTTQISDNEHLARNDDEELAELAEAELPQLRARQEELELQIQLSLLPPDPNEERNAIMEIRAGTGGNEAAIFAGDLYRMYTRYCETNGYKLEQLELSESDLGGIKEVIFQISGDEVFRNFKYESGVHRVQRVPVTETQGRIHTSTATVAVLPEAQEVDLRIKPDELRIDVSRSGGPGGQSVNTTDSAVQVTHLPTGIFVKIQESRSQHKNREKAISILRSRLLEAKQREEQAQYAEHRKSQIGGGGREEKVRTYNFPQNRLTDHRIGLTLYNLDHVMEGNINEIIQALQAHDMAERLKVD
jgi:peptide chain release factor 1